MKTLLLDTHVWCWIISGKEPNHTLKMQIINAGKNNALFLSAISIWEIALLNAKGRITLDAPCQNWVNMHLKKTGVQVLDLSIPILIESCYLPGELHADPADRLLISTARNTGTHLVTADKKILDYGKLGYLNVIEYA